MSRKEITKEDQAREATALRIQKVKPEPAPEHMTEKEYSTWADTRRFFVSKDVLVQTEEALRIVMCRMCLRDDKFQTIKGHQLLVRYEDDPLRAVGSLATAQCHGCGFEMHVNIPTKVLSAEQKRKREVAEQMEALSRQMKSPPNWGGQGLCDHRGSAMAYSQREAMEQERLRYERDQLLKQIQYAASPPMHIRHDMDVLADSIIKKNTP
jgi:hypothetical protein